MATLSHKIDFALIIRVKNANPNGDPLNGNRPRQNYDGLGEISDVALKRKLRDRLQEAGQSIFVQSEDCTVDGLQNLRERAESSEHGLGKQAFDSKADPRKTAEAACAKWFDVRAFGQLFAFTKGSGNVGVSIPVRGPVTLHPALSIAPISVESVQITKSVSSEDGGARGRGSDTMGMKHRVDGVVVYECYGSMNPQLAERTGFSDEDAEVIKAILPRLFENDASSARPDGSMEVAEVFWWEHDSKAGRYSSAKVHGSLTVSADGSYEIKDLPGLQPEVIAGF